MITTVEYFTVGKFSSGIRDLAVVYNQTCYLVTTNQQVSKTTGAYNFLYTFQMIYDFFLIRSGEGYVTPIQLSP